MLEAFVIIVTLGGLELTLWLYSHREAQKQTKEMSKQTEILEEIAVGLVGFELTATKEEIEVSASVVPN